LSTDFQDTGLLLASAKLSVKYWPGRWNTGDLATLMMSKGHCSWGVVKAFCSDGVSRLDLGLETRVLEFRSWSRRLSVSVSRSLPQDFT